MELITSPPSRNLLKTEKKFVCPDKNQRQRPVNMDNGHFPMTGIKCCHSNLAVWAHIIYTM